MRCECCFAGAGNAGDGYEKTMGGRSGDVFLWRGVSGVERRGGESRREGGWRGLPHVFLTRRSSCSSMACLELIRSRVLRSRLRLSWLVKLIMRAILKVACHTEVILIEVGIILPI
jgi:hypothetical protein